MRTRIPFLLVGVVATAVALATLAGPAAATRPAGRVAASSPSGSITVFAASSLTEVFNQLGKGFQKRYRNTSVTFNYNGSNVLETQIEQSAPADVFASADTANMDKLTRAGDDAVTTLRPAGLELPAVGQAPHRVRADAQ